MHGNKTLYLQTTMLSHSSNSMLMLCLSRHTQTFKHLCRRVGLNQRTSKQACQQLFTNGSTRSTVTAQYSVTWSPSAPSSTSTSLPYQPWWLSLPTKRLNCRSCKPKLTNWQRLRRLHKLKRANKLQHLFIKSRSNNLFCWIRLKLPQLP